MISIFAQDIEQGLSASPKYLSSKYFYDAKGDEIFQQIMAMPEYYLTRSEYEIFTNQKEKILNCFGNGETFDLIEFGAGDGKKTKVLLKYFLENKVDFKYLPIDISQNALDILQSDVEKEMPYLDMQPLQGEYFKALSQLNEYDQCRKAILFLGSNIGNFTLKQANDFLSKLNALLQKGDKVLIGFDLKKDPKVIRAAYNDEAGITKAFNLNLLRRINAELGGDFDLSQFKHESTYNPETGEAKSFLISQKEQKVTISHLSKTFAFNQWESVFMEVSQKYDLETINSLAESNGFKIDQNLFDCKHYFVDSIWQKV